MQYCLDKLDDAIYYYLTLNKNVEKSQSEIYNALISEDICPDLIGHKNNRRDINKIEFKTICFTMDLKYDSIKKCLKNGNYYLIFSDEPLKPEPCAIIESDDSKITDANELLFKACQDSNIQAVENLLNNHDIDIKYKKDNLSFYDVLSDNHVSILIAKKLFKYEHKNELLNLHNKIKELKQINTLYLNEHSKLKNEVCQLKKNNNFRLMKYMSIAFASWPIVFGIYNMY